MSDFFGEFHPLAVERKKRGLTQSALATNMGWSAGRQGQFECGLNLPSPEQTQKLADFFGVDAVRLGHKVSKWKIAHDRAVKTVA